jgi:O-antigen ligase
MKEARNLAHRFEDDHRAMKWLIWGGSLVSLGFWSNLNDPFNAPKSWILSIAGFWLLAWVLFQIRERVRITPLKFATIFAIAYIASLSLAFISTDNKFIGFFGEYQRRTGLLSYMALISFFLASSYLFTLHRLGKLEKASLIVGLLTGIYGFAQHFNLDVVHWKNHYNSVLSTLGNPDFAAALMAIFLILNFGIAFQKRYALIARAWAGFNVLLLSVVIYFSHVRQGMLTAFVGVAIILIVRIYQRSKVAGLSVTSFVTVFGLLAIFGMLDKGPIAKYLYKESVTLRGDYWRAGWRMFSHHPLFGVGLDRYGANFRQYRDSTQALRHRGPDFVSNAAHSVPIQLASTGGIFVLVSFLLFTGFIGFRGITAMRKSQGRDQMSIAVIFAAWIAYELQSLVSIDNLAIAVWGYILGGAVVGISAATHQESKSFSEKRSILQPLISSVLALTLLTVSALFFGAESSMKSLKSTVLPHSQRDLIRYEKLTQKPLTYVFEEPSFALTAAEDLFWVNNSSGAISRLKKLINRDPHAYDPQEFLARIYEFEKNWPEALLIRKRMLKIDPYNPKLLTAIKADEISGSVPQPIRQ